jgi:hypothetical protein
VAFGQHPPTKSAQHTALTLWHAEGCQARVGTCAGSRAGLFQRVVLIQTCL